MIIEKKQFQELFKKGKMSVSDSQYDRLKKYSQLLVEWNEKINLTAITDPEGISLKHFYDSVYPFTMVDLPRNAKLIDVGTGAGFPSCPLKIFRDDVEITLLDSLNKRVKFLQTVSDEIYLEAQCIHGRAEELGKNSDFREQYDIACARAVANLTELCEYCLPFVKIGGMFIALKGSNGLEELIDSENAIKILGGKVEKSEEYALPNGDGRVLIVIRKVSQTPNKYPRNKGQMKKHSL